MSARIKFVRGSVRNGISFDGQVREDYDGVGTVVAVATDFKDQRAAELRIAMQAARRGEFGFSILAVSDVESAHYDAEYTAGGPISFSLDEQSQLNLEVEFSTLSAEDDQSYSREVSKMIRPFLARNRCVATGVEMHPYSAAAPWVYIASFKPLSLRGRTVGNLLGVAQGLEALLTAVSSGTLTLATALALLRAGRPDVLVGQMEGPWLDAKREHYDLSSVRGKISLAQAVARFANAENGGLIVVGLQAKRIAGGEVIRGVCPVPRDGGMVRKYQQAIERHLYPPPDYCEIESVDLDEGMLVLISLPPQEEELKPFLVHGALVGTDVEGAFISIVRRRGETSIPIQAASIHATLAAGRALLRRGEVPK